MTEREINPVPVRSFRPTHLEVGDRISYGRDCWDFREIYYRGEQIIKAGRIVLAQGTDGDYHFARFLWAFKDLNPRQEGVTFITIEWLYGPKGKGKEGEPRQAQVPTERILFYSFDKLSQDAVWLAVLCTKATQGK